MSDRILVLTVSGLVAGALGCLLIPVAWAASQHRRPEVPHASSWIQRLGPWLGGVPLPAWLERQASGQTLTHDLARAAIPWAPRNYLAFRWVAAWAGSTAALLFATTVRGVLGAMAAAVLMAAAFGGPAAWLKIRADRRSRDVERELPDFLDRLTLALSAGLGFEVALRRTAAGLDGLLGEELRRCVRYLDWGQTKTEAMALLTSRNPSQDVNAFAAAVRQAESLGSSLATTLRVQRDLMRARRRRRAQEASRRLPVLILFPLVFFFLPALLIVFLAPPLLHLFLGR